MLSKELIIETKFIILQSIVNGSTDDDFTKNAIGLSCCALGQITDDRIFKREAMTALYLYHSPFLPGEFYYKEMLEFMTADEIKEYFDSYYKMESSITRSMHKKVKLEVISGSHSEIE